MAGTSMHKHHAPRAHSHRRPGMVRMHHTWHGEFPYRSHFEDFMREIGVDAREIHPCCVPRPAMKEFTRIRSMSEPSVPTTAPHESLALTSHTMTDRGRSEAERNIRRQSFPTTASKHPRSLPTPSASKRPSPPPRFANVVSRGRTEPKHISAPPLKAQPVSTLYTQNHGASYLCTSVSADQALRNSMRATLVGELTHGSAVQAHAEDQELWAPLPQGPALVPLKGPSRSEASAKPSLSRVPSFASLETISSSEGPETPRGHSPLNSPLPPHAHALSPSLSYLEKQSRLRVPGQCVSCKRTGHNFPSCPACGDMWCSRECRVRATAGSKHICPTRQSMQNSETASSTALEVVAYS